MIKSIDGKTPKMAPSAIVSEMAYISGNVEIGEGSVVWPGAVIRAESHAIRIGNHTCIEDGCVLHAGYTTMDIGDNVIVGHGAVIHGERIGNNVLIGINATVLPGVVIGDFSTIAAGSVVAEDTKIPPRSFVAGVLGKIRRRIKDGEVENRVQDLLGYLAQVSKRAREEGF